MSSHFAIAGIQMNVSACESNLPTMDRLLKSLMARFPWVQMVLFSELAPYGPHHKFAGNRYVKAALETFSKLASHHKVWLIPGSLFEKKDDKIYNMAPVFNPEGELILRYHKLFPFSPYEEDVTGGSEFGLFDVPNVGKFGLAICYDMWFPETIRTLAVNGAEVILHPTMTDTIDRDVELSIARTNAVTNQCYFFDINGSGDRGIGHSVVLSPSGTVLHQAAGGEVMIPVMLAMVATLVSTWGLLYSSIPWVYWVTEVVIGVTWAFVMPFLFGMAADFDKAGRTAALGNLISLLGLTAGPMVAAELVVGGYTGVIWAGFATFAMAMVACLYPALRLDRRDATVIG